jgi:hypothetical protein
MSRRFGIFSALSTTEPPKRISPLTSAAVATLLGQFSESGPSIGGRDLNALSRINKEGSGAAEVTMVLDFALFFASVTLVACAIISWLALLCRHTLPQPQHIMKKRLPVSNLK